MKISEISPGELTDRLLRGGLLLDLPPFRTCIRSNLPTLGQDIARMYGDFAVAPDDSFCDFHVEIMRSKGWRGWIAPKAHFFFDGQPSFVPLPVDQAFAMLEWGLNWCVAAHSHQYLVIHAAVIERNGKAILLPGPPGAGKSTLCAALVSRNWRLLSDELALYDMANGLVYGMARPVNLKNNSIEIIKAFSPTAEMTGSASKTAKGTVALMRPPTPSVGRVREPAKPSWIVLPKYNAGSLATMAPNSRSQTFLVLAEQSFNYEIHGLQGFKALGKLVDQCQCHQFTYGNLNDAVHMFDRLLAGDFVD